MGTAVTYPRTSALYVCVLVMLTGMTWTFLGMRAVMDVGGACASGGPYVSAQPCPSGTGLLSVGIPLMMVAAFVGSGLAMSLQAPTLLLPMWWLVFGTLGWNFLEYGAFSGDLAWGWIVCGVVFELMALPALAAQVSFRTVGPARIRPETGGGRFYWPAYGALAVTGVAVGYMTFRAWT